MYCQTCRALGATRKVYFVQHVGALVVFFHKRISGNLCRKCVDKYFKEYFLTTLFLGWWGAISFLATPVILLIDLAQYILAVIGFRRMRSASKDAKAFGTRPKSRSYRKAAIAVAALTLLAGVALLSHSLRIWNDQTVKYDAAEESLSAGERALQTGDYVTAEPHLRQAETYLAAAPEVGLFSPMAERSRKILERVAAQRREIENTRHHYTSGIRLATEGIRVLLEMRAHEAALIHLSRLQNEKAADPVFDSLSAFIARHAKSGQPTGPQLTQACELMAKDAIAWKSTRMRNKTADYVAFLKENPQSPFAEEARARLVDLEVAEIRGSNPGTLPSSTQISSVRGRTFSVINVHNQTPYELTLRYSGPDSFMVTFAPNEKGSMEVLIGQYSIAASVRAKDVQNYAGDERSTGGNFQVSYYIKDRFSLPQPAELINAFEPWANKRSVPSYLK